MRRLPVAVLLAAVAVAACGTASEVDPDATVEIRGQVVHQDGSPVGGTDTVLVKEIGVDEFLSGATTVMTTWGFACVAHADVDPCGEYAHRATTGGDGAFRFELRGADVQSGFRTASTMTATAAAPADGDERAGAATSLSFLVQREALELPTLHLWEPDIAIEQADGQLTVDWPTLPEGYPADASYEAVFVDAGGRPVWTLSDAGSRIDVRVLEDLGGGVAVQATAETSVDDLDADVAFRSGQHPVEGPGAPPSRRASCSGTDGELAQMVVPCPLTDGDLATLADVDIDDCPEGQTQCPAPADSAVVIDLNSELDLSLLVLRGDEDDVVVDVSGDGRTWTELLSVEMTGTRVAVGLPPGTTARTVRLRAESGDIGRFAEISLW